MRSDVRANLDRDRDPNRESVAATDDAIQIPRPQQLAVVIH